MVPRYQGAKELLGSKVPRYQGAMAGGGAIEPHLPIAFPSAASPRASTTATARMARGGGVAISVAARSGCRTQLDVCSGSRAQLDARPSSRVCERDVRVPRAHEARGGCLESYT